MAEEKAAENPGASEGPKEPPFFSQFSKEFRESPEAKRLYNFEKPEPLARALLELQAKAERSILIPDPKNADEVKAFKERLGIPEKEDGYGIKPDALGEGNEKTVAGFTALFLKAGLSKAQAKDVFDAIQAGRKQSEEARIAVEKQRTAAYKAKILELGGGDVEKAKGVEQLYKLTLAKRLGSKDLINRLAASGFLDDPEFMEKMVATGRLLKDDAFVEGASGGGAKKEAKQGTMGNYSEQWKQRMEGKE